MFSILPLALRALLLAASFTGLCAALRVRFGLNRFVAPFTAVCCIIIALMFGGMLGLLKPSLYLLYALGLAGLAYAYLIRRARPEWGLMLALALVTGFLAWRYYPCHLVRMDDFSHWGQAARHLLSTDRFPNAGDTYIYFQSYPLGTACFIYYIGRALVNIEGIYVFAQGLLYVLLFLPMFALVRRDKGIYYPILAALCFVLFCHAFLKILLVVDLILAFFGIGIAASIAAARDDWKAAVLAALPAIVAVALVKNSGLFFSAISAFMLASAVRRCGMRRGRSRWLALGAIALSIAAYAVWTLHIRVSFPAALESKHAVSISAYMAELQNKNLAIIGQIARAQLGALFHLQGSLAPAIPFLLFMSILLILGGRKLPREEWRAVRRSFLGDIGLYALWFLMIFLMYVFSMPESEAVTVASFSRYNGTGLAYLSGLIAILLLDVLQRGEILPRRLLRALSRCAIAGFAAVFAFIAWPGSAHGFDTLFERSDEYSPIRDQLIAVRDAYGLQNRGSYLTYYQYDMYDYRGEPLYLYYVSKYEYETGNFFTIMDSWDEAAKFYVGSRWDQHGIDDAAAYIAEMINGCDAFLIMDPPSPEFDAQLEAFLTDYAGDTPIYRAYQTYGRR